MTLINHPGSDQQMAVARARCRASPATSRSCSPTPTPSWTASPPATRAQAARQAAAILDDTDSLYDLQGLAGAVSDTVGILDRAVRDALAGIPGTIPGS